MFLFGPDERTEAKNLAWGMKLDVESTKFVGILNIPLGLAGGTGSPCS